MRVHVDGWMSGWCRLLSAPLCPSPPPGLIGGWSRHAGPSLPAASCSCSSVSSARGGGALARPRVARALIQLGSAREEEEEEEETQRQLQPQPHLCVCALPPFPPFARSRHDSLANQPSSHWSTLPPALFNPPPPSLPRPPLQRDSETGSVLSGWYSFR